MRMLIQDLRRESSVQKADIWKRIADDLEMPTRTRRVVNLSSINRYTKADEVVVVPGKVLGSGALDHKVIIAAFAFSEGAREQVEKVKGTCITIPELVKKNPKGKDVRILG